MMNITINYKLHYTTTLIRYGNMVLADISFIDISTGSEVEYYIKKFQLFRSDKDRKVIFICNIESMNITMED